MARSPKVDVGKVFVIGSCRVGDAARCLAICGYEIVCAGPRVFTIQEIRSLIGEFLSGVGNAQSFREANQFVIEVSSLRKGIHTNKDLLDTAEFYRGVRAILAEVSRPTLFVSHFLVPDPVTGTISRKRQMLREYLQSASSTLGQGFFDPTTVVSPDHLADCDHYNERGTFKIAQELLPILDARWRIMCG